MGRTTWLMSSNIEVPGFYESFGFRSVATITLGEDNPTWTEAPVVMPVVRLMTTTSMEMQRTDFV